MNRDKQVEELRASVERQEKSAARACDAVARVVTSRRVKAIAKAPSGAGK